MRFRMPRLYMLIWLIVFATSAQAWWVWTPGDHVDNSSQSMLVKGYHPKQPIPFDHKLHAGDRKIQCEYCHSAARRSPTAGIPPLNTCMGCHKFVKTESPPIKYLAHKVEKNEPVEWTKVHDLPDYVRFSHQPHVLAKDAQGKALIACQDCHGTVEKMKTAEQWAPLQMGWCVECHNRIKEPATATKPAVRNAPVTCNTCHY